MFKARSKVVGIGISPRQGDVSHGDEDKVEQLLYSHTNTLIVHEILQIISGSLAFYRRFSFSPLPFSLSIQARQ